MFVLFQELDYTLNNWHGLADTTNHETPKEKP